MSPPTESGGGLTRRQLLLGGAASASLAIAGAGLAVASTEPLRTIWDRITGRCGPAGVAPPPSDVKIGAGTFRSRFVSDPVGFAIGVPPEARHPAPVAICLPARGSTAEGMLASTHLPDFVAAGIRSGVAPFVVAFVDGGTSYWHARTSGEDRISMLLEELIPMLESRGYGGSAGRAILGWSMGGYGAILAAERSPYLFSAVAAASPAIYPTFASSEGSHAFDSPDDFAANDVITHAHSLEGIPVRVDCGTADPFHDADVAFVRALPSSPQGSLTGAGCHDAGTWMRFAPAQVRFLGDAFARG